MEKSEFKTRQLTNGLMITKYTGKSSEVIFPAYIDGQKVISIGAYVFTTAAVFCTMAPGKEVFRITIPETVRSIENTAFFNCQKLEYVKLHSHIISIGSQAFAFCNNLKTMDFGMGKCPLGTVHFPPALQYIGVSAFTKGNFFTGITGCIFKEVRVCSRTKMDKPRMAIGHRNTFDYEGCRLYSYDKNFQERLVNVPNIGDAVELDLKSDFGFQLYFKQRDFEYLPFEKLEEYKILKDYANILPSKSDVHVSLCETKDHIRFLRLSASIPIFDSYDSMYDRWHNLYLIRNPKYEAYDAVYAVGGYVDHSVSGYKQLLKIPDVLVELCSAFQAY